MNRVTQLLSSAFQLLFLRWGAGESATFFEGWSLFKFNNLGLALGTTLKFYTNVAKVLKLKVVTL